MGSQQAPRECETAGYVARSSKTHQSHTGAPGPYVWSYSVYFILAIYDVWNAVLMCTRVNTHGSPIEFTGISPIYLHQVACYILTHAGTWKLNTATSTKDRKPATTCPIRGSTRTEQRKPARTSLIRKSRLRCAEQQDRPITHTKGVRAAWIIAS